MKAELPPGSLDGRSCRRALLSGKPGEPFELLRTQPPSAERRRTDQDDLVLDQRLALELRRDGHAADDGKLDPVEPHELERTRGRSLLELDLDARVALTKRREQLRQQVGRRDPRSGDGERSGPGLGVGVKCAAGVREERLGAQHIVRKDLAARRQRRALTATDDKRLTELGLERGEVLRHRRLAHVELIGRAGERAAAGDRRERAEPRLQLHHSKL